MCMFIYCVGYTMSQGKDNARLKSYKNKSLNTDEMRRRREEEGLQLRKQKKDEQVRPWGINPEYLLLLFMYLHNPINYRSDISVFMTECILLSGGIWNFWGCFPYPAVVQEKECGHCGGGWSSGGGWDVRQWVPGIPGQQHGPNYRERLVLYLISTELFV